MSMRAGATIVGMSLLEPWWTAATEADATAAVHIYIKNIYTYIYIYIYINTIRQCGGGPALNNTGAFSIRRRQPGETTALKRHWLVYNICIYNGIYMWYIYIYILYCDISIYESPPCLRVAMIRRSLRVVAAWW